MFTREHLIIGAVGFILGGAVATASIMAVLSTQSSPAKDCPPIAAVIAPQPTLSTTPPPPTNNTTTNTVTPSTDINHPTMPAPTTTPVVIKPVSAKPAPQLTGLEAEEKDRLSEEQRELEARKQSLTSQLKDSDEIIRLKEQQIKELEAQLKQQP